MDKETGQVWAQNGRNFRRLLQLVLLGWIIRLNPKKDIATLMAISELNREIGKTRG